MEQEKVKILAFEYVLANLVKWYKDAHNSTDESNDISILKSLKLLFFISAISTEVDKQESLLDKVFNNFVAMQYGHVESDVYDSIKANQYSNISINNKQTTLLNTDEIINSDLDTQCKHKIELAISKLKETNPDLIKMSPFDLVELSHCWYSWKYYFAKARSKNAFREDIPNEIIKLEQKIFFIN